MIADKEVMGDVQEILTLQDMEVFVKFARLINGVIEDRDCDDSPVDAFAAKKLLDYIRYVANLARIAQEKETR